MRGVLLPDATRKEAQGLTMTPVTSGVTDYYGAGWNVDVWVVGVKAAKA